MNSKSTIIKRWLIVAMGFVLIAIIFIYFYNFSPIINDGLFFPCVFKMTTGLDCVGCGGQRAFHELLHFNLITAFDYNALFVLSLPLLIYYITYSLRRYIYGKASPDSFWYSPKFGFIYIFLVILFLIIRNLPYEIVRGFHSSIPF